MQLVMPIPWPTTAVEAIALPCQLRERVIASTNWERCDPSPDWMSAQ